jgi:hypothetical protein
MKPEKTPLNPLKRGEIYHNECGWKRTLCAEILLRAAASFNMPLERVMHLYLSLRAVAPTARDLIAQGNALGSAKKNTQP